VVVDSVRVFESEWDGEWREWRVWEWEWESDDEKWWRRRREEWTDSADDSGGRRRFRLLGKANRAISRGRQSREGFALKENFHLGFVTLLLF
jgi:hypothetical protein